LEKVFYTSILTRIGHAFRETLAREYHGRLSRVIAHSHEAYKRFLPILLEKLPEFHHHRDPE
jgi:hypothetical protein